MASGEESSGGEDGAEVIQAPPREELAVVGASAGGLGGALAAGFAALCCVGPSTVALLGAGGAIAAAGLKPYRPLLLALSLAMLGFGFWRAYGQRAMAGGKSCPVRVGRFARVVLWCSAAVWLLAALLQTS